MAVTDLPCTKCKRVLSVESFSINRQQKSRGQRHSWCRECKRADARRRYLADPQRHKRLANERRIKSAYGMNPAEYAAFLTQHGGKCAICGRGQAASNARKMCVDHDHETGKVRGLLCTPCNLMIGYAADDPGRLTIAAKYLRTWSKSR